MLTRRLMAVMGMVAVMTAAHAKVVYENDFSVRTSVNAIPSGEWSEMSYAVGRLVNRGNDRSRSGDSPRHQGVTQDGWMHAWIRNAAASDCGRVISPDGNPVAYIGSDKTTETLLYMRHPVGNEFRSGFLELTADCAASSAPAPANAEYTARIMAGGEHFIDDYETEPYRYTPFVVGVCRQNSGSGFKFLLRSGEDEYGLVDGAEAGHWYRYRVLVDLNEKKFKVTIYDQGETTPTLTDPNGAVKVPETGWLSYYADVDSINAIGLAAYNSAGKEDGSECAKGTRFDNIIIRHGATADTLREYYINDFAVRRSRRAVPGTTSHSYADSARPLPYCDTNTIFYTKALTSYTALQNVGDRWQTAGGNNGKFRLIKIIGEVYPVLRATSVDTQGIVWTPIGTRLTSGKVIAQVDFNTPQEWKTANYSIHGIYLSVGTETGVTGSGRVAQAGVRGHAATEFFPAHMTAGANGGVDAVEFAETALAGKTWHRVVITVDLDHNYYDWDLYEQGALDDYGTCSTENHPNGRRVGGATHVPFCNASATYVNSVALWTYTAGNASPNNVFFDNLRIWAQPTDAADDARIPIYENYFDRRLVWPQSETHNALVGDINLPDDGQDEFTRRSLGTGQVLVSNVNDDPVCEFALGADSNDAYAVVTTPLGGSFRSGKLKARVDIRPPSEWFRNDMGGALFTLGSDKYGQFNYSQLADVSANDCRAAMFGFVRGENDKVALAAYGATDTSALDADIRNEVAVDTSCWYRFELESDLDAGTCTVRVFNMGTTKPVMETATPDAASAAATFNDLRLCNWDTVRADGGISVLGLSAFATVYSPFDKKYSPMFDNIRVKVTDSGLILIVR